MSAWSSVSRCRSRFLGTETSRRRSLCRPTSLASPQRQRFEQLEGESRLSPVFERLLTSFQNIFKIPELRTRILFTMGMLVVYRIGAHIPTPGINGDALSEFLQKQGGALLGLLDIFAGIVARLPAALAQTFDLYKVGQLSIILLVALALLMVVVVAAIVFLESGRRKVPVQYAKRVIGRRVFGGQSTHIPLKINTAGVIPPIFASSIIAFPATIAGFIQVPWVQSLGAQLSPGSLLYTIMYVGLIVFFCFFYTAVVLNPVDMAENMKKYGGFIPGIRPRQRTSDYIYNVLTRITFGGSIYF